MLRRAHSGSLAFTLAELAVATAIMGVLGVVMIQIMWQSAVLFAKNSAVNVAHQEARTAVMRMEGELHSCVSVPQLVDASRNPVVGFGPSVGIAFQSFAGGPYRVAAGDYAANQNTIDIIAAGVKPTVNQRLNIPTHTVEAYITAITTVGANYHLVLDQNLQNEVNTTLMGQAVNISGFVTEQVAYLVQSGQLRRYPKRGSSTYNVMTTDVTSPTPFSTPQTPAGAAYNRFVAAINLSSADPTSTARGFRAANMYLNSMVPYRYRMTETQ